MTVDLSPLNNTGYENLSDFLYFVINFAISASVLISVISLILSGFKFIFSFGDEKKIKAATQSLLFSLLGLVLVFVAPAVIQFVINQVLTIK